MDSDAFLLAFGGKEIYIVIVCQLAHYGLHVLHTHSLDRLSGDQRTGETPAPPFTYRVQSCVQFAEVAEKEDRIGVRTHRKSII